MSEDYAIPPRNGEGDRAVQRRGGGGPRAPFTAPIKLVKRARKLRREMSLPEVLLWQELRKRPGGFKFRRQHPHIAALDFACMETRLAIEVDGEAHNRGDQPQYDVRRDQQLADTGYVTLRIPAREILADLDAVIIAIVAHCIERGPLHHPPAADGPPPRSGEEFKDTP